MKITVITGKAGKILGTAHHGQAAKPEAGDGRAHRRPWSVRARDRPAS